MTHLLYFFCACHMIRGHLIDTLVSILLQEAEELGRCLSILPGAVFPGFVHSRQMITFF